MAIPRVVRIQPSLVPLIARCCICSKSAAKSLPKVEAGYQLNAGPIRRRRLDRAARKRRFLGLSWLTGRDASLSSHPALGLRCRLGGGIYPFFGPSKLCAAPVAQLDRALPYEGRGREFESRRVRHHINDLGNPYLNLCPGCVPPRSAPDAMICRACVVDALRRLARVSELNCVTSANRRTCTLSVRFSPSIT